MKLYIARHCEADSGEQLDPTRELTKTGKKQAKMMGKWLKRQTEKPELLVQSNFKRSQQTAKRYGKALDLEPITCGEIDPDGTPEAAWAKLKELGAEAKVKSVLAVTHGPLVEELLAYLTGSPLPKQFHFAHGAVAHFEATSGKRGVMHWMVTPKVVARDEDEMDKVTSSAQKAIEAAAGVVQALIEIEAAS